MSLVTAEAGEPRLACDMRDTCTNPVTHISRKGYVYCTPCGRARHRDEAPRDSCREMREFEIDRLLANEPLESYEPVTKAYYEPEAIAARKTQRSVEAAESEARHRARMASREHGDSSTAE